MRALVEGVISLAWELANRSDWLREAGEQRRTDLVDKLEKMSDSLATVCSEMPKLRDYGCSLTDLAGSELGEIRQCDLYNLLDDGIKESAPGKEPYLKMMEEALDKFRALAKTLRGE